MVACGKTTYRLRKVGRYGRVNAQTQAECQQVCDQYPKCKAYDFKRTGDDESCNVFTQGGEQKHIDTKKVQDRQYCVK